MMVFDVFWGERPEPAVFRLIWRSVAGRHGFVKICGGWYGWSKGLATTHQQLRYQWHDLLVNGLKWSCNMTFLGVFSQNYEEIEGWPPKYMLSIEKIQTEDWCFMIGTPPKQINRPKVGPCQGWFGANFVMKWGLWCQMTLPQTVARGPDASPSD